MRKMKKDSLYLVEWQDHFSTQGWYNKGTDFANKKLVCKTAGIFVGEDTDHVHLAQTENDFCYGDIMSIMKSGILKVKKLQ